MKDLGPEHLGAFFMVGSMIFVFIIIVVGGHLWRRREEDNEADRHYAALRYEYGEEWRRRDEAYRQDLEGYWKEIKRLEGQLAEENRAGKKPQGVTAADLARLTAIKEEAEKGRAIKREDLLWTIRLASTGSQAASLTLIDQIRSVNLEAAWKDLLKDAAAKLARATPQEHDFPPYVGLIDQKACQAIPLRFRGKHSPASEYALTRPDYKGIPIRLLEYTPASGPTEAVLVIRPWIRPQASIPPGLLDILRMSRVTILLDGKVIVPSYPIDDFLVGTDGFGYRAKAFEWPPLDRSILRSGSYNSPPVETGLLSGNAANTISFSSGIFITRENTLDILLHPMKEFYGPVGLTIGLVCGLYTTSPLQ